MYFFIISFMFVFGGLNYYVGLRGWQSFGDKIPFLDIKAYWIVFVILVLINVVGLVRNKFLPDMMRSRLYIVGSYWLAAMAYIIIILVAVDLILFVDSWVGFLPQVIKNNPDVPFIMGLIVVTLLLILVVYGTWNGRKIKVTSYDIQIPKQAGDLRQLHIALISDTHLGTIDDKRHKKIIYTINSINPDIVMVAGDITDDINLFRESGISNDFKMVTSTYGMYASFGNHEYFQKELGVITDQLEQAGMSVLRDAYVKVAESFYLIGREDKSSRMARGKERKKLEELMKGMDIELPVIMLDHQPIGFEEAKSAGVDLQLSGHTHKGQFWPFNLITRRIYKNDYGYLKTGDLHVIVTSGAATWGPPIRIGTSSEVVHIIVNFG